MLCCRSWTGYGRLHWPWVSTSCWRRWQSCWRESVPCYQQRLTRTPHCRWRTPPTPCVTRNSPAMPRDSFFHCRQTLPVGRPLLLTDSKLNPSHRRGQNWYKYMAGRWFCSLQKQLSACNSIMVVTCIHVVFVPLCILIRLSLCTKQQL